MFTLPSAISIFRYRRAALRGEPRNFSAFSVAEDAARSLAILAAMRACTGASVARISTGNLALNTMARAASAVAERSSNKARGKTARRRQNAPSAPRRARSLNCKHPVQLAAND